MEQGLLPALPVLDAPAPRRAWRRSATPGAGPDGVDAGRPLRAVYDAAAAEQVLADRARTAELLGGASGSTWSTPTRTGCRSR